MKSTLRLKFIMLYIIFGFLSIFTVSLLSNQLLLNKLEQDSSQNMYRIANQPGLFILSCRPCSCI